MHAYLQYTQDTYLWVWFSKACHQPKAAARSRADGQISARADIIPGGEVGVMQPGGELFGSGR